MAEGESRFGEGGAGDACGGSGDGVGEVTQRAKTITHTADS